MLRLVIAILILAMNSHPIFCLFETGARLELMHKPQIHVKSELGEYLGIAHFAISVGDRQAVDHLTQTFVQDGYQVVGAPRITGDGYYESVIIDPEGNRIEITE